MSQIGALGATVLSVLMAVALIPLSSALRYLWRERHEKPLRFQLALGMLFVALGDTGRSFWRPTTWLAVIGAVFILRGLTYDRCRERAWLTWVLLAALVLGVLYWLRQWPDVFNFVLWRSHP